MNERSSQGDSSHTSRAVMRLSKMTKPDQDSGDLDTSSFSGIEGAKAWLEWVQERMGWKFPCSAAG